MINLVSGAQRANARNKDPLNGNQRKDAALAIRHVEWLTL